MKAKDLMRAPVPTVHVDQSVQEARALFDGCDGDHLIVLEGGEAIGHLERQRFFRIDNSPPAVAREMVGNIMQWPLPLCRLDDDRADIEQLFAVSTSGIIAVVDQAQRLRGYIDRADMG